MRREPHASATELDTWLALLLRSGAVSAHLNTLRTWRDDTWSAIIDLAFIHRVGPLLLHCLRSGRGVDLMPAAPRHRLETRARHVALRSLRFQAAFQEFASHLAGVGIPVVALKGVHLAMTVYRPVALRELADVDVLVALEHVRTAKAIAEQLGYQSTEAQPIDVDLAASHHLNPMARSGINLEIHWRLAPPGQDTAALSAEVVLPRAVPMHPGRAGLGLATEDLLLHLCAHTAHQHYFEQRLAPLWDVAFVLQQHRSVLNGAALIERARHWRIDRGVFLTLTLVQDITQVAVPPDWLAALRPKAAVDVALAAAHAQVFHRPTGEAVSRNITHLVNPRTSVIRRVAIARDRAVVTGDFIARGAALRGRRYLGYRLRRVISMTRRHGWVLVRLLVARSSRLARLAHHRNVLDDWLNGRTR